MLNKKYLKELIRVMTECGCSKDNMFSTIYEAYIDKKIDDAQLLFFSDLLGYFIKKEI